MRKLHKKPLIMAAATLALTGTLAVGSAMAYFTTYSTAGGGVNNEYGIYRNQSRNEDSRSKREACHDQQISVIMTAS